MVARGLAASPVHEVLVEQSVLGWKEFELELMRDKHDNVVVVCSIENLDPMGVHTGDSITVAPAMTLTDREYQHMRDIGIAVLREVGVDTGGCNIQFAINPADGAHDRHRDEPAGVALVRAGVEGHRLPDREDRGEARGRLHPRRDPQRHHPQDAGRVRADPRLRRGEGAALRVREVPRRRPGAHHAHEERRRGDGDRPQLHRGARQGAALDGDEGGRLLDPSRRRRCRSTSCWPRAAIPTDGRLYLVEQALRAGADVERGRRRPPASTRGSSTRSRSIVELRRRGRATRRRSPRPCCARRSGTACPTGRSPRCARSSPARTACARCGTALGIRPVFKTVDTCAAEFAATTPYHYSSYDEETEVDAAAGPAEGDHPRQRAEPDRAGHRVRLLVRARGHGAARRRLRDRDGQLQPGDGVDRLRHRRPAVLRAADLRGRPRGRARRAAVRHRSPASSARSAGRRRSAWRSGSRTPASRCSAPSPRRSTSPSTAARSAGCWPRPACRRRKHGTATSLRRGEGGRRRDRLPGAGAARPTCSAGGAWRSSTTRRTCPTTSAGPPRSPPTTRCWSTGSSTTRSRSTSTRSTTAPSSTSAA